MKERVAVITGGARGIGRAVAEELKSKGHKVIILDKEISDQILREKFICYEVNVMDSNQVKEVFELINREYGVVGILVNTIGATLHSKAIEDIEDADWKNTFDLNVLTAFYCTRAVVAGMKQAKWGRIVNISAVAGRTYTFFGGVDFTAAKAAVIGFTRQCAFELAKYGITVNAVAPGLTMTERVEKMWNDYDDEKKNLILKNIPVGRPSTVREQAMTICFLCCEEASYICGEVLDSNGAMFVGA